MHIFKTYFMILNIAVFHMKHGNDFYFLFLEGRVGVDLRDIKMNRSFSNQSID